MSAGDGPEPRSGGLGGLCPSCVNVRCVTSASGSTFLLCEKSRSDERYPKYPPQPVVRCDGFAKSAPHTAD